VVAETRAPIAPPPPAPATIVEEGEAATEKTVTQAALKRRPRLARASRGWWWSWMKTQHLPHRRRVTMPRWP
jgi:hypothetical protein